MSDLDIVSIGAAGTFVVRRPLPRAQLRGEFARRLPFEAEVIICEGRDILRLVARDPFARHRMRSDVVPFVSVLAARARSEPSIPVSFPSKGRWLLKVIARDNRFVLGMYRRHMKVIRYLGMLDRLFGVPVTTRTWTTILAIASVLESKPSGREPAEAE